MHVILHVGAHRTASSAFQYHLASHREVLTAANCAYWGPRVTRGGLFRRMMGGLDNVLPWETHRASKRVALRALKVQQDGFDRLIVSDENMLGSLRATLEDTRLYRGAGARVAGFASGFDNHQVTVALGIRNYADWWTSALAFRLVRGGLLPKDRVRECMVTQPRRWRHLIEEIARALPDAHIVVWTYEALGAHPSSVLLELAEIDTPATPMPPRNARPGTQDLRDYFRAIDVEPDDYRWEDGLFMPFSQDETEALAAQYDEDLAWLSAGAGGFADHIDAPAAEIAAQTAEGRGSSDDGDDGHLGRTGRQGTAQQVP